MNSLWFTLCLPLLMFSFQNCSEMTSAEKSSVARRSPNSAAKSIDTLPPGVPRQGSRRECFLPGEIENQAAAVEQAKISLLPRASSTLDCRIIGPQVSVSGGTVYSASTDVHDCLSLRRTQFYSTTPLVVMFAEDVLSRVARLTNDSNSYDHLCVVEALHTWARAGALTQISDVLSDGDPDVMKHDRKNASYTRMWRFGGLSSAYFAHLKLRQNASRQQSTGGKTKDDVIREWFKKVAGLIAEEVEDQNARDAISGSMPNTHVWRAYSILPTGLLLGDKRLLDLSYRSFGLALAQITTSGRSQDRGYLPVEFARLSKSLAYHSFSAHALLGMAVVSMSQNCDFVDSEAKLIRLTYLLRKILEGQRDPSVPSQFERHVEQQQGAIISGRFYTGESATNLLPLFQYLTNGSDRMVSIQNYLRATLGSSYIDLEPAPEPFHIHLGGSIDKLIDEVKRRRGGNVPSYCQR